LEKELKINKMNNKDLKYSNNNNNIYKEIIINILKASQKIKKTGTNSKSILYRNTDIATTAKIINQNKSMYRSISYQFKKQTNVEIIKWLLIVTTQIIKQYSLKC